jgi:hypothetical protein
VSVRSTIGYLRDPPVGSWLWQTELLAVTGLGVVMGVTALIGGFPVWIALDAWERRKARGCR